jgi:hypothetical protein
VTQGVEPLATKLEALSSNTSTTKKEENKKERNKLLLFKQLNL